MSLSKFIIFSCLLWSFPQASHSISLNSGITKLIIDQDSERSIVGSMKSGDIQVHSLEADEGKFFRIFFPGFHTSNEIGSPELPEIHKLIEIPQNALPRIEVVYEETEYYNLSSFGIADPIFPYQPSLSKSQDPDDVLFEWNEAVYEIDDYFSPELISVDIKGQLRSLRLANLVIRPIDYNPVSGMIKVTTNVEFIIHFDGADLVETANIKEKYYSPYFESVYHQVVNYE